MLVSLLGNVDLFSIWAAVLLALGFRIAVRCPGGRVDRHVVLLWLTASGESGLASLPCSSVKGRRVKTI